VKRLGALALIVAGTVIGLTGNALSGSTILAVLLILAGGWWGIPLMAPTNVITLDEACDIVEAEQRAASRG